MNILICTIVRNGAKVLDRYMRQITDGMDRLKDQDINWYISIYENDSTDGTKELLQALDLGRFKDHSIISEDIGTRHYPSIVDEDRVRNLAIARNKALTAKDMFMEADHVLWVEPDLFYAGGLIPSLIMHRERGLPEADILSGINIASGESRAYDTWATRRTADEEWGDRTSDWFDNPVARFYTTFNGVCLYNAEAFRDGVRFGHINERLGKFDCDTVVVCENFRKAGYDRIYVDQSLNCYHDR